MRFVDDKRYKKDLVNGEGIRRTLFCTGCPHHCKGCFNKEAWDFNYGELWTKESEDMVINDLSNKGMKGLSLLGGEPFNNTDGFLPLVKRVRKELPDRDIWIWTGYTFEQIMDSNNSEMIEMLKNADILIDGKFEEKLYDPKLDYRGSSNQRIIDVKRTLKENKIVLYKKEEYNFIKETGDKHERYSI